MRLEVVASRCKRIAPCVGPLTRGAKSPLGWRMKLTWFRFKDRVPSLNILEVGLIDDRWYTVLTPQLAAGLKK